MVAVQSGSTFSALKVLVKSRVLTYTKKEGATSTTSKFLRRLFGLLAHLPTKPCSLGSLLGLCMGHNATVVATAMIQGL